ncbi:hypothetical protein [Vibrio crassostreae]|uniref:hypothetical protein n=1 Tax=Vibrio crassostreae TaxID=246167 RepID=UPI001B307E12|nr:hypothetical protein [Vibrio crassostreae]
MFGTTKEVGMSNFGNITLIASKDLRARAVAEMYDCDIYSPRSPEFIYDVDSAYVVETVARLNAGIVDFTSKGVSPIDSSAVQQMLRGGVKVLNTHGTSTAMMLAYALESGLEIELEYESKIDSRWELLHDHTEIPSVISEISTSGEIFDWGNPEHKEHIVSAIKQARKEWQEFSGDDKTPFDKYCVGARSRLTLSRAITPIVEFVTAPEAKLDTSSLNQKLLMFVFKNEDYTDWLGSNFGKSLMTSHIQKFNPETGESWEVVATPDNILSDYKERRGQGEGSFYGAGSLRAKLATNLNSEDLMARNAHRIISGDQFEKHKDSLNDLMFELCESLKEYSEYDLDNHGIAEEIALCLESYKERGIGSLTETFSDEVLSDDSAVEIYERFVEEITFAPTEYFEAKVYENIKFADFECAIVPDNISESLLEDLRCEGIERVVVYPHGDESQRLNAIKGLNDPQVSTAPNARRAQTMKI